MMNRTRILLFTVIAFGCSTMGRGDNCGSNTDWSVIYPAHLEVLSVGVGDIDAQGLGHEGATICTFKIRMNGTTMADGTISDIGEALGWTATADRTEPYPEGSATAETWCANGGTSFMIGSGNTITFEDEEA